ncbi:hemolysin [Odoribacter laneus]|jgi:putative hemolysin secretion transport system membrane protein|uniref:HlyD family secretion protein n=1 Tax=Odoribacter laneus TaxID=626933 RepID=UPI001899A505|nr:HlyD family efflux transporter periplasmic adaptor subunit [Odoribacter laneus]GKI23117.1 hemolysin [Odoribacter laneus]GKI26909.1 hemolysin [Odoribacter laneus]
MPEKDIELRSEEVQEVMGHMPSWILRWGITLFFVIILTLLIGSFFFRYPDTITATMTLTSDNPAVQIIARANGRLTSLYIEDKQKVGSGDYLAVIENTAVTEDILQLRNTLVPIVNEPDTALLLFNAERELKLGNAQSLYTNFLRSLYDFKNYKVLNYYPQKINSLRKQIGKYEVYHRNLIGQLQIQQEQYEIGKKQYDRDSILFEEGILAAADLEVTRTQLLQKRTVYEQLKASIDNLQIQIGDLEADILDYELQQAEKEKVLYQNYSVAAEQLLNEINNWELNYVLKASVSGIVSFTQIRYVNQYVTANEIVFNIVPGEKEQLIGKAMLPAQRSGKVKVGQRVIIRFTSYPDQEFGIVKGQVSSISLVPNQNNYMIEILLPDGLHTNYKKELPFSPEMEAQADIITDDLRLIERFFMPLKKIFKEGFESQPEKIADNLL